MIPATARLAIGVVGVAALALWANSAFSRTPTPVAEPIVVTEAYRTETDGLSRNETLSHLFGRHSIYGAELIQLLDEADEIDPRRVRENDRFEFTYLIGGDKPFRVKHRLDADRALILERDSLDTWRSDIEAIDWTITTVRVDGEIESSLALAMAQRLSNEILPVGERVRFVDLMAKDIYGWQIDFTRDLREGDRFKLLFERLESSEGEVRFGRLLAGVVETMGRENWAYVIQDERGRNAYYDERGRSLRRAFLLDPIKNLSRRISSGFNPNRMHPVLGVRRPHRGTDFAASYGAQIVATGDGTVRFAGRDGGYGIMVSIRHPAGVETRYAHLSRVAPGIHPGARVSQGDLIGFVGQTGLANGPHVHYEFIKNGVHLNHRRVDMGDGKPVPESLKGDFEAARIEFDMLLNDDVSSDTRQLSLR